MHAKKLLHKLLDSTMHQTRIKSLIPVVTAVIDTKQLSLTRLGRGLNTPGKERAGIRRMDRLLANKFYQEKNDVIYESIIQYAVGNQTQPIILVDWSGIPNSKHTAESGEQCLLRASLAADGRSITLYDEVHSKKKEANATVHKDFLTTLKSMLPEACKPIIVTDAGFKTPWFRVIESLGWDYVGRVRGKIYYRENGKFEKISTLFPHARSTPKALGEFELSKENLFLTNFYLYTHKLKGRKKHTKTGAIDNSRCAKRSSKGYREPWVIVSSLSKSGANIAKRVIKIYKKRMTIEENFRDVKSVEYGFSLNENKTIKVKRLIVWLMLSALASLLAWIVGYIAEQYELHYDFQANTYRKKRVLSFFFLGCQVIRKKITLPINFDKISLEAWGQPI